MSEAKLITEAEVALHNKEGDCWIILGNEQNGGPKAYDVTKYLADHPGGPEIIMEFAGKYADGMFEDIGHSAEARKKATEYLIGPVQMSPGGSIAASLAGGKKGSHVQSKGGLNPVVVVVVLAAIAVGAYFSRLQA